MISISKRKAILELYQQENSLRKISRDLNVSRKTIARVLRDGEVIATPPEELVTEGVPQHPASTKIIELLPELFKTCRGNGVRIGEILEETYGIKVPYSTLMRYINSQQLRDKKKIVGEYHFKPGEEMQHDTSPHVFYIAGKKVTGQCASLVLGYSRILYAQYYPSFTRFEAQSFLREAIVFMQGACQRCVIDNSSVILAGGSGRDAVVSSEFLAFSRTFGFEFFAHALKNPERKGKIERPYTFIERNFLAGRTFESWEDLNKQLADWCKNYANVKPKRELGGECPNTLYMTERTRLVSLPLSLPPVYEQCTRKVSDLGFVNFECNRYGVPESLLNKSVQVYKYIDKVEIYYRHQLVVTYKRLVGVRGQRLNEKGFHPTIEKAKQRQAPIPLEEALRKESTLLHEFITALKKKRPGRASRPLKQLQYFKRQYPRAAFEAGLKRALTYALFDMNRIESLIIKNVTGDFFNLAGEDDEI